MQNIIQKAIEGGWIVPEYLRGWVYDTQLMLAVTDSSFWQALGKACGWADENDLRNPKDIHFTGWCLTAMKFHEINLTEGWDKAVSYLEGIIKQ